MYSTQRAFFEKGWIRVDDQEVLEYLNLTKFKDKVIEPEDLEIIFSQEPSTIANSIKGMNTNNKILVFNIAREKYVNGELSNIHVIKAIEEALGEKLDPNA